MTDMKNYSINETHIMIVRKDAKTGMLTTDYLPLVFEDQHILDELKSMSKQKGVKGIDIYNAAVKKGLGYLLQYFNFCEYVSSTYQYCPTIITEDDVKRGAPYYQSESFIGLLESRVLPYCLSRKYAECKNDQSIVAYSTRYVGWSNMNYNLNEDLSITYLTNFGYGWANYFVANLKYKDIDILPYSMWVNYYKANLTEILRYTRSYHVHNDEWETALKFGCEVCNYLTQNPSGFANKWLIGEVQSMVDGLCRIFNDRSGVIAVNESNGSYRKLDTKEEITLYKGEKISGALSFIEKIRTIEKLNVSMDIYISTILNLNRQMVPELMDVIETVNSRLAKLVTEKKKLEEEIEPLEAFLDNHINDCVTNFIGDNNYGAKSNATAIMESINPNFKEANQHYHCLIEKRRNVMSKIGYLDNVVAILSKYVDTIKRFLEENDMIAA